MKWWFNAEAVHTAHRRQQALLLWIQHLKMREKIKRRRELRRGVAHIFITPTELDRAAKLGTSGRKATNMLKRESFEPSNNFEEIGPEPYSFRDALRFEDTAEMHQKAQATVEAAADLVALSLPTVSEQDGRGRQLALKAEAARLTEAFEEQQRQLLSPGRYKIASARGRVLPGGAEGQNNSSSFCQPGSFPAICIGPFKLYRNRDSAARQKEFISMEKLQQKVQQRMCDCFTDMAAVIRTSQVIFEAKGTRLSEVEAMLNYEYGDLRVRLDRKIKFANEADQFESELDSEESRDID